MKNSSNLNISCKVVFSLNKWNKKVGSPSSFGRKRPFISLNNSASIGNLSSSERARARARANHAKNDAQKGCAMQLNGITLILFPLSLFYKIWRQDKDVLNKNSAWVCSWHVLKILANCSLDVLIKKVLIKKKECRLGLLSFIGIIT